jgi:hypothetical protein
MFRKLFFKRTIGKSKNVVRLCFRWIVRHRTLRFLSHSSTNFIEGCIVSNSVDTGTGAPFSWVKRGRGVTLTTHLYLVPRSRMSRSYTSLPIGACKPVAGQLYLYRITFHTCATNMIQPTHKVVSRLVSLCGAVQCRSVTGCPASNPARGMDRWSAHCKVGKIRRRRVRRGEIQNHDTHSSPSSARPPAQLVVWLSEPRVCIDSVTQGTQRKKVTMFKERYGRGSQT